MTRSLAVAVACTLVFPAALSAQGSLRDSIAREATRAAFAAHTVAQLPEPAEDWNVVRALKVSAPIRVKTRDGRTIAGSLASADAGSITIDKRWGSDQTLPRADVLEVRSRPRFSKAGYFGIGMLSGLAAGAFVGWAGGCSYECTGEDREMGLVLGAAFGAGLGAVIGPAVYAAENEWRTRLIYRASVSR